MTEPRSLRLAGLLALCLPLGLPLGGCISTAVAVVGETLEAGVEITGAAAGAVVDVVTPDGGDDEDGEDGEKPGDD